MAILRASGIIIMARRLIVILTPSEFRMILGSHVTIVRISAAAKSFLPLRWYISCLTNKCDVTQVMAAFGRLFHEMPAPYLFDDALTASVARHFISRQEDKNGRRISHEERRYSR